MYSFLSSVDSLGLKNQFREQIFSLLGNSGKTLFQDNLSIYAEIHTSWYKKIQNVIGDIWNTPHKRFLSYLGIICSFVLVSPPDTSFAAESQKFIVTAYYSPLPNQSFYFKWNYAAEKRLNGNGTHGASGAPVFAGMIAAPKSYDFGTHIFFEGLGLWTVSDRWGAIVEAWDRGQAYDRIDVWMWHGEAGLKRALAWGRREVVGTIVSSDVAKNINSIDLDGIDNGRVNLSNFPSVKPVPSGGISSDVLSAFADLGYIPSNGNVEAMILQFQLDHSVVASKEDFWAGNYGPKTKAALKTAHDAFSALRDTELESIEKAKRELLDERSAWENRYNSVTNTVAKMESIKIGDSGEKVIMLQWFLAENGFFKGAKDGKMKWKTLLALRKYQRDRWLVATGRVDKNTKQAFIQDIIEA